MNYVHILMSANKIKFNESFYVADTVSGEIGTQTYYFSTDFLLKSGSMTNGKQDSEMLIELLKGNKFIVHDAKWRKRPLYGQVYYYIVDDKHEYGKFNTKKKAWNNNLTDFINYKAGNVFHNENALSRKKQSDLYSLLKQEII